MMRIVFFAVMAFCLVTPALAEDSPALLGKYDGWSAYEFGQGKAHICYALGEAKKPVKPPAKDAAPPHLMVTHRPGEKSINVVEADLGTDLPANGQGTVAVAPVSGAPTSFDFFTKNHSAWAPDADTDKAAVTAMAKSKLFSIDVKPAKGAVISAAFPLIGFPQALAAIDKACKIKR